MMTRRNAILIGLAAPAWAFSGKEFWNEKKPSDWTEEEIQQMLTRSPWAKEATVSYYGGPGGATARSSSARSTSAQSSSRTKGGGRAGSAAPGTDLGSQLQYRAVVRWESALPIRQATHSNSTFPQSYVICVSGDVPAVVPRGADETEMQRQERLEMLKEFTKLDRHGDPIYLSKVEAQGSGTWFYFPRLEPIKPEDKQITFVSKLGPVEVKAKFMLKEMMYQGKLEL